MITVHVSVSEIPGSATRMLRAIKTFLICCSPLVECIFIYIIVIIIDIQKPLDIPCPLALSQESLLIIN